MLSNVAFTRLGLSLDIIGAVLIAIDVIFSIEKIEQISNQYRKMFTRGNIFKRALTISLFILIMLFGIIQSEIFSFNDLLDGTMCILFINGAIISLIIIDVGIIIIGSSILFMTNRYTNIKFSKFNTYSEILLSRNIPHLIYAASIIALILIFYASKKIAQYSNNKEEVRISGLLTMIIGFFIQLFATTSINQNIMRVIGL